MTSPAVPVPCKSHRHCFLHRYHNDLATTTTPDSRSEKNQEAVLGKTPVFDEKVTNIKELSEVPPIRRLPVDVFLDIIDFLGPCDRFSLALTCHSLFQLLRNDV